jgi:hypothetical protein
VTTTDAEYQSALRAAERDLVAAATADDVRNAWRKHFSLLGHRALGRLLLGRPAAELAARRSSRAERE